MRDLFSHLSHLPDTISSASDKSAIEIHFPHIARGISYLWQTNQVDLYLDNLLIDTRGDRVGFSKDVLEELMLLSGMRWHLQHVGCIIEDFQKPGVFSFSAMNEADIRRHAKGGAWVLE
jgi:hypothetical protein